LFPPRGSNPSWGDAIYPHLGSERLGQAAGEGHHRTLNGAEHLAAVARHARFRLVPADIENYPAAGLTHADADGAGQINRARYVQLPEPTQRSLKRPVGCYARGHVDAGVDYPHTNRPLAPKSLNERGTACRRRQVGNDGDSVAL